VATIDMGLKEGVLCPFRGALGTRLIQCGMRRGLLPYQVASSSIQPFGHNSIGCHLSRRNISTNYYLVVEMHTVTVRSDDMRYLHIVLDGFPALRERGTAPPLLGPCLLWPRSPISATAELLLRYTMEENLRYSVY